MAQTNLIETNIKPCVCNSHSMKRVYLYYKTEVLVDLGIRRTSRISLAIVECCTSSSKSQNPTQVGGYLYGFSNFIHTLITSLMIP